MMAKDNGTVDMQLITVELGNGQRGIFIGTPLIITASEHQQNGIKGIWFSDIQKIHKDITVEQLTTEVNLQVKNTLKAVH